MYSCRVVLSVSYICACVSILEMAQFRREDAGNTGATFYKVTMEPANWYKWFRKQESSDHKPGNSVESIDDNDSGWTKVQYMCVGHVSLYLCRATRHTLHR